MPALGCDAHYRHQTDVRVSRRRLPRIGKGARLGSDTEAQDGKVHLVEQRPNRDAERRSLALGYGRSGIGECRVCCFQPGSHGEVNQLSGNRRVIRIEAPGRSRLIGTSGKRLRWRRGTIAVFWQA